MTLLINDNEPLIYDLSIVKEASDDIEYIQEITKYFIESSSEMLMELDNAFQASELDKAQNAAHKLSSNFYMFGLNEGAKALSQIDINLMNKEYYNEIPALIAIAKTQGEKAITQLKKNILKEG
jgi:HPt (histidine-containing phosphotransfer) domain-containing protein